MIEVEIFALKVPSLAGPWLLNWMRTRTISIMSGLYDHAIYALVHVNVRDLARTVHNLCLCDLEKWIVWWTLLTWNSCLESWILSMQSVSYVRCVFDFARVWSTNGFEPIRYWWLFLFSEMTVWRSLTFWKKKHDWIEPFESVSQVIFHNIPLIRLVSPAFINTET